MNTEELELRAILRAKSLPLDLQHIAYSAIERAMQCYQAGSISEQALVNLLDRPRPHRRTRYCIRQTTCLQGF